jgi:hypothetical protein
MDRCKHSALSGTTLEPKPTVKYCEHCNTMTCVQCGESFFSNARKFKQRWTSTSTTGSSSYVWGNVHEPLEVGPCEHEVNH